MERAETPANLPKNVEEAAGIFRVGEDAELAYRLQEQGLYRKKNLISVHFQFSCSIFSVSEYVDVQHFNENERKIVAHDIRLAKRVQVNSLSLKILLICHSSRQKKTELEKWATFLPM